MPYAIVIAFWIKHACWSFTTQNSKRRYAWSFSWRV